MFDSRKRIFCAISMFSLCFYVHAVCLDGVIVSGGEDHTIVLTGNKTVWTCGANGFEQLGTPDAGGSSSVLLQVHDGEMNTASGYLEDAIDIAAGWTHSIALDDFGYVWT